MKKIMFLALISATVGGGALFAQPRFSIGISIGDGDRGYYAPPQTEYAYEDGYDYQPPCPEPGYVWTQGSWYQSTGRRLWRTGYWAAPSNRAYGIAPRAYGQGYARGYERNYAGNGNAYLDSDRGYRNNNYNTSPFRANGNGYYRENNRDNYRDNYRR